MGPCHVLKTSVLNTERFEEYNFRYIRSCIFSSPSSDPITLLVKCPSSLGKEGPGELSTRMAVVRRTASPFIGAGTGEIIIGFIAIIHCNNDNGWRVMVERQHILTVIAKLAEVSFGAVVSSITCPMRVTLKRLQYHIIKQAIVLERTTI